MEATITEQSWKGHSFTLLVFAGIVVLSSIFFMLGMLVGKAQGQKLASAAPAAAAKADAKPAAKEEDKTDFTFYDSVKKEQPAALTPAPAKQEQAPAPSKAEPALEQLPPKTKANVLNYQIGALRKSADAERLLSEVKKKGFKAYILSPHDESNPYYRVQVGPFKDPIEAEKAKKNLEAAGFKPMLKK